MFRSMFLVSFLSSLALHGWKNPTQQFVQSLEPNRIFSSPKALLDHYRNMFDTEIAWMEEQICNTANITREELHRRYEENIAYYQSIEGRQAIKNDNHLVAASPRIEKLAREVLKDFNVMDDIAICAGTNQCLQMSAACAVPHTIAVNEEMIAWFSDDEVKGSIAHELQHVLHHDVEHRGVIEQLVGQDHALMLKFTQIQEIRADVLAMAKAPYYAQCWQCMSDAGRLGCDDEHLTPEQRLITIQAIQRQHEGLSRPSRLQWLMKRAASPAVRFWKILGIYWHETGHTINVLRQAMIYGLWVLKNKACR
jgi:hypothetical protein